MKNIYFQLLEVKFSIYFNRHVLVMKLNCPSSVLNSFVPCHIILAGFYDMSVCVTYFSHFSNFSDLKIGMMQTPQASYAILLQLIISKY